MSIKTFKDWAWDEGFDWPLKPGSDQEVEARAGCGEYLKLKNAKVSKEEDMANIYGICVNCERAGVVVDKGSGLCGSCKTAQTAALNDGAKVQALARAREKFKGKPKMSRGKNKIKIEEKIETKTRGERLKKPDKERNVKRVVAANPPWAPVPLNFDIAIKIPFTKRFINVLQIRNSSGTGNG